VLDYMNEAAAALKTMTGYVNDGKLTLEGAETVDKVSFNDVPATWRKLFVGGNTGKLVTQLSEE
jgi:NADPH-dependent curcumin reductase CurA